MRQDGAPTVNKLLAKAVFFVPLLVASALAVGALACGCGPPVPATPSYAADVRPIFLSHCVRCHGAGPDGGMLNNPTEPTGPDATPLASDPSQVTNCYLNQYHSTNCALVDGGQPANCHYGAQFWATTQVVQLKLRLHGAIRPMPPPPAPLLDDWEMKVVDAWIAAGAPP